MASKAKPVVKKAAPKAAAKPVAKPVAKPSKPVAKVAAKPVVKGKPAAKPVAKKAVKTPVKAAVKGKAAAKPVATPKAAVKAAVKPANKPVSKSVAKVKPAAQAAAKAAPKTTVKPVAKPVAKPATKVAAKAAPTAPVKAEKPAKPEKAAKPAKAEKVLAAPAAPVAAAPVVSADVPVRAVRPSARLAQITVPSMAQSVASTAAKASYLQNMPSQVLTPPPFVAVKKDAKLANNWKTKKPDQLTDAEVMAMSDNDYMNDAQMAFFRLKLVALKQGILANAGETTEHLREDTVVVPDPADRATIEEEHALELRTRDRERKLLKKIEQSIQRIDAGDYGYCDETGEPIGVGRLLARPTANLSLEAQQRRELKQKMFGD
ncbi:MAG: RNA polymerase-binding protein DksA [Pseudomonadota bacterium]|nr:RNA polymerase-binding protein DksA [Pseudomonadota bacterium]